MGALTRDAILFAPDLTLEPIEVPEWGGTVHLRVMNGATMLKLSELPKADFTGALLVHTLCDADGKLLFAPEDVEQVMNKNHAVLQRLIVAAIRINSLDPAAAEKKF